jgi:hypothetical protein
LVVDKQATFETNDLDVLDLQFHLKFPRVGVPPGGGEVKVVAVTARAVPLQCGTFAGPDGSVHAMSHIPSFTLGH